MELEKLIENLEYLDNRGVRSIKLVFCEKNLNVKQLLNEIKLRDPSKG
jgi:hypothetical protein